MCVCVQVLVREEETEAREDTEAAEVGDKALAFAHSLVSDLLAA